MEKNKFMGGWEMESRLANEIVLIIMHFIKYMIYVCRNRRVLATVTHLVDETTELITVLKGKEKWRRIVPSLPELSRGVYI